MQIMKKWIQENIKGKKVLILGFGREGKSTYSVVRQIGGYEELGISDRNPVDVREADVKLYIGEDYQKCLPDYDIVIKSPGIVLEKDPSACAYRLLSQTEIFFSCYGSKLIGITGTKGKSTTTTLLHHILKQAGRDTILAGNIGIPAFDIAGQVKPSSVIVFEMSSHQLEYMTVSPKIGVFLNVHEEHLDHYGTMEKYVAAKQNIYKNQTAGDLLYCNIDNMPLQCESEVVVLKHFQEEDAYREYLADEKGWLQSIQENYPYTCRAVLGVYENQIHYQGHTLVLPVEEIPLVGSHNYFDIGVVYGICQEYGIDDQLFLSGVKTYETLPHRLQYVGTYDGIRYYDDSISTICDTAIQALSSVKDADTILIGGMDRGIDYTELIDFLDVHPISHIILMEATGERIYQEIQARREAFRKPERILLVKHLEDAVRKAKEVTQKSKSCILSPAAASYGIFKDFNQRGEAFQMLIKQ